MGKWLGNRVEGLQKEWETKGQRDKGKVFISLVWMYIVKVQ